MNYYSLIFSLEKHTKRINLTNFTNLFLITPHFNLGNLPNYFKVNVFINLKYIYYIFIRISKSEIPISKITSLTNPSSTSVQNLQNIKIIKDISCSFFFPR